MSSNGPRVTGTNVIWAKELYSPLATVIPCTGLRSILVISTSSQSQPPLLFNPANLLLLILENASSQVAWLILLNCRPQSKQSAVCPAAPRLLLPPLFQGNTFDFFCPHGNTQNLLTLFSQEVSDLLLRIGAFNLASNDRIRWNDEARSSAV